MIGGRQLSLKFQKILKMEDEKPKLLLSHNVLETNKAINGIILEDATESSIVESKEQLETAEREELLNSLEMPAVLVEKSIKPNQQQHETKIKAKEKITIIDPLKVYTTENLDDFYIVDSSSSEEEEAEEEIVRTKLDVLNLTMADSSDSDF
jgi:sulfur carrier protein ThiS